MPLVNVDEILTQGHIRSFIQWGGPSPSNPVGYYGKDAQYVINTGVSNPETGGVDPVWVSDPDNQKRYRPVSRSISTPDLPNSTLTFLEKHGLLPRQLLTVGCNLNYYEVAGACSDLADFLAGWSDYVMVYSQGLVTDKDLGDRQAWDSDDQIEDALSMVWSYIYPVGQLAFGEEAATQIDREVVDVTYAMSDKCTGCNYGDKWLYAVTAPSGAGSPGLPAELIYSLDYGDTWTQVNIDGLGATEATYAIRVVGGYLVILGDDAYYYATINNKTGIPGTFTKVSTGFVAAGSPKDMYVLSSREIFFVGDGGYIYKSTNIQAGVSVVDAGSATTNDLKRLKGNDDVMVAVGASGTILKSINRGRTWGATADTPTGVDLLAVEVAGALLYWVGSDFPGRVFYTEDGGETWTEYAYPEAGVGAVKDIVAATRDVLYIATYNNTPTARLWTTWDGGADWTREANRIQSFPTFDRINRIAVPASSDPGHRSNTVALAGLAGDGTDGILLQGVAGKL